MNNAEATIEKFRQLEILSEGETIIHKCHPLIKLVTTVIYLTVVISFKPYDILALMPYLVYIVIIKELSEIPIVVIWDRLKIILPLIIGMGIFNPLLDPNKLMVFNLSMSMGWISFLSLLFKGILTISAMILLIGTSGINGITYSLKLLRLPDFFLMTFSLIYRYIGILLEEIFRMSTAYSLRSKRHQGIKIREWGSFAGNLLLRTIERAEHVHRAMLARGFKGQFYIRKYKVLTRMDVLYLMGWTSYFLFFRLR